MSPAEPEPPSKNQWEELSREHKRRRLFFALWPDDAIRDELVLATRKAVTGCGGRPVPAENLHITLAFLHSVEEKRLQCIFDAAAGLNDKRFELRLDTFGVFPRAGIFWLGPSRMPRELLNLVDNLWRALEPCGFSAECRQYNAHVTLARKLPKRVRETEDFGTPRTLDWQISAIALAQSHTLQAGARYTVLQRWPLSG